MTKLSPQAVKEKLELEPEKVCFVDVRSQDEFLAGHVPGAICLPLDAIESGTANVPRDKLVVLSCQSGSRSARAKQVLEQLGFHNLSEMEGGYRAWAGAGLPTRQWKKSLPVMRQVMITAGSLVFFGTALGVLWSSWFFFLPGFVGAGLIFSGWSGWCGMALLLERMPWNR